MDGFTAAPHGAGCGFDDFDNTKTQMAIGDWLGAIDDTINEMFAFNAERFRAVDFRRPHVAGPIADTHFVNLLRIIREADALVIDL